MNTTTTKIAGEAAMTDKMQANDRPTYIFLGPGDVIRATDERYSSTYHKWKPIAPLYVGSTVDASTRPVRRRALLASKDAVPWIAHWSGSNPYKGWSIRQGRDEVIWFGETISSETVEGIVLAHNKCFDCDGTGCVMNCSGLRPTAPAQSCGDAEQAEGARFGAVELILRDVCEDDPADPDLNDTVCIDISDLKTIVERHIGTQSTIEWAVGRWNAEVSSRPLVNVHRRSLDDTWRQVIRHLGGDDAALLGPRQSELLAAARAKDSK